jgi:hypothetical protein
MILPEVQDGNGQLRHRRLPKPDNIVDEVGALVQQFDAFVKVTDDVREEPRVAKGICECHVAPFSQPFMHKVTGISSVSVLCFALISVLVVGQLHEYWTNTDVEYKFSVDTDFEE